MQRILLLAAILLLSATWMVAQSSSSSSSSPSSSSQTSGTSATPGTTGQSGSSSSQSGMSSTSSTGSETSVQGCLTGSNGNYTLTDNAGTAYQLTGDNSDLSKHVNEEVSVRGTQSGSASPSTSSSSASGSSNSTSPTAGAAGVSAQSFSVTTVKKVSDTCTSSKK